MVYWTSMAHSVNDILLVSMVKDTDGPAIWSDGPRNRYDPEMNLSKNDEFVLKWGDSRIILRIIGKQALSMGFCIGRSRGPAQRTPPTGPNSFVFTCILTEKHPHRRSTPPPPPYGKSWIRHCFGNLCDVFCAVVLDKSKGKILLLSVA